MKAAQLLLQLAEAGCSLTSMPVLLDGRLKAIQFTVQKFDAQGNELPERYGMQVNFEGVGSDEHRVEMVLANALRQFR